MGEQAGIDWFKAASAACFPWHPVTNERNDYFCGKSLRNLSFTWMSFNLISETQLGRCAPLLKTQKSTFKQYLWVGHFAWGLCLDNIKKSGSSWRSSILKIASGTKGIWSAYCIIRMNHFFCVHAFASTIKNQQLLTCRLRVHIPTFSWREISWASYSSWFAGDYKRRANDKSIDLHKKAVYVF
jgi:hypothetical protein